MNIPVSAKAVTAEWLTEALRLNGTIQNAAVKSVEIARVSDEHGRNKGLMGISNYIKLSYDLNEANAPDSLYVKFSTPHDMLERVGAYQNEVRFYQQLASRSTLRTPHCYYSDINTETGEHILLLEDISPARNDTFIAGYSPKDAERAIRAIAKFHSIWWESPELNKLDWLTENDLHITESEFQGVWDNFAENFELPLPESFKAIGARYGENLMKAYDLHRNSPRTLLHGDYQIENMLFSAEDSSLVVIDWQFLMRGCGVWDVAFNLCSSLQTADRRTHEMSLLHTYHSILIENGVLDYTFNDCFHDYCLSMLRPLHIFVVVIGYGLFEGEDRTRAIDALLPRFDATLTDLKVAELLSEKV